MLIQSLGPQTLFSFTNFFHGAFVLYTLVRMRAREAVPPEAGKGRFAALLRTSPFFTA